MTARDNCVHAAYSRDNSSTLLWYYFFVKVASIFKSVNSGKDFDAEVEYGSILFIFTKKLL